MSVLTSAAREVLHPATKFQSPPARAEHIRRERCLTLLSEPKLAARHLLISAPAGAGKSTLAAQWAAGRDHAAWVSLAEEDNGPGEFWTAFVLAVRTVLLLDDLQLIRDAECHDGLRWLLERAPANVHIAICTRTDPLFPTVTLVARGRLVVLRGSDLRFDIEETTDFLRDVLGLTLAPDQIAAIEQRTDGWAAGLYLTALSLRAACRWMS